MLITTQNFFHVKSSGGAFQKSIRILLGGTGRSYTHRSVHWYHNYFHPRNNCFKCVRPRDINILFQKPKWRLLYEITKKILLTCLELLPLFALAFTRVKNANGITPVLQAILYLWYIHFEITGDSGYPRVVLNSVIYPQIVPFFALNRIFFPASEKGTIKQHNQTDFKSRLK